MTEEISKNLQNTYQAGRGRSLGRIGASEDEGRDGGVRAGEDVGAVAPGAPRLRRAPHAVGSGGHAAAARCQRRTEPSGSSE